MPKVVQIRGVPDEVHDALARAAEAQGLSLTKYVRRELEQLARQAQIVQDNAAVVQETKSRARGRASRDAILAALHEGRGD